MRAFFALEIEPEIQYAIEKWRDRTMLPAGRAVPAANFHITLHFLGSIDSSTTGAAVHRGWSDQRAGQRVDIRVAPGYAGVFPQAGHILGRCRRHSRAVDRIGRAFAESGQKGRHRHSAQGRAQGHAQNVHAAPDAVSKLSHQDRHYPRGLPTLTSPATASRCLNPSLATKACAINSSGGGR